VESVQRYHIIGLIKAIRRADLVISGGGSLFQDVTSTRSLRYYLFVLQLAQFLHRKTMIYAQGVGPLQQKSTRDAVAKVLNKVDAITVRDSDSKALLESIGVNHVPIHLSGDPSFLVEPDLEAADNILDKHNLTKKDFVTITLRPWSSSNDWLHDAAEGIHQASQALGIKVVVIPMQESEDMEPCSAIKSGILIRNPGSVRATKGIIARSAMVIGMRLHSLIFAAGEGVPFVPIIYDPKVASFAEMAGQNYTVNVESLKMEDTKNAVISAWNDRAQLADCIKSKLPELEKLTLVSGQIAANLL